MCQPYHILVLNELLAIHVLTLFAPWLWLDTPENRAVVHCGLLNSVMLNLRKNKFSTDLYDSFQSTDKKLID